MFVYDPDGDEGVRAGMMFIALMRAESGLDEADEFAGQCAYVVRQPETVCMYLQRTSVVDERGNTYRCGALIR